MNNWHEYDQSLRDRGDITLWISHDAIDAWSPPMTGKRGAQPLYSDLVIESALTLRLLFRLPVRQTEGFLRAILTLMDLSLPCPDHTTVSRRGVDGQGQIIASTLTESHEQDPSQVPTLLDQIDSPIARFIGDGMYDQAPSTLRRLTIHLASKSSSRHVKTQC